MRFWIIFSLAFFLTACEPSQADLSPLHIETATGVRGFKVELARTPNEQARGLMFRRQMPADQGMLFIFPEDKEANFWMKNTILPLDLLFVRADGTIVTIHPMAEPYSEKLISSGKPVRMVLEILGGQAAKQGIRIGDKMTFEEK